jgi:hypothetical protein
VLETGDGKLDTALKTKILTQMILEFFLAIINSRYMQMVAGELYNQQKTLIDIILIFTIN